MYQHILAKFRHYPYASVFIPGLLVCILVIETRTLWQRTEPSETTVSHPAPARSNSISNKLIQQIVSEEMENKNTEQQSQQIDESEISSSEINPRLATLLANQNFEELRDELLQLASAAVSENDKNRLGYILNLLGQVSIHEQDFYSAEVYLMEALGVFEQLGDEIGTAQINLQLGRTHLKTREVARTAGTAYDELQVGRLYLLNGFHEIAKSYIKRSIEGNLSINRYGSAASAYESLAKLYLEQGDNFQAQQTIFESARLYAASGKLIKAKDILKRIPDSQNWQLVELNKELDTKFADYNDSILQIERARDYRSLYNFYKNKGDNEQAWKFRLLANNSLGQVSKRALFHRQQGVLSILYNSNESMSEAQSYFIKAKTTFNNSGLHKLAEETDTLKQQVY